MIYTTKEHFFYYSLSLSSKIILLALLIFSVNDVSKLLAQDSDHLNYSCTQVIGFSQVGQTGSKEQSVPGYGWYIAGGIFESIVGDKHWQLIWNGGGGVDKWIDSNYEGWNQNIISPCNNNFDTPDRVLFSISGPYGKDVKAWSNAIIKVVDTIQQKIPTAERIILQPVIGGPDETTCPCTSNCNFENSQFQTTFKNVRASWQHKYIAKAIEKVIANQEKEIAVKGYFPQVLSCSHYIDGLGHLTRQGAEFIGKSLGNYYK
ncbi:MAG: hypothetical protein ROO71_06535 [Balneola sp.]